MSGRELVVVTVAATLCGMVGGCGAASGAAPDGGIFIAFGSDFVGFRSWPSQSVDSPVAQGATHVSGARTVFINRLPPPAATAFPVGTMIVKVTEADGQIFARVKRGGGYNQSGAVDWEWFELEEGASSSVSVKWHGVGPPAGEKYGGDANSGCNPCHAIARSNDYVLSPWLRLGGLVDAGTAGADADSPRADGDVTDGGVTPAAEDAGTGVAVEAATGG